MLTKFNVSCLSGIIFALSMEAAFGQRSHILPEGKLEEFKARMLMTPTEVLPQEFNFRQIGKKSYEAANTAPAWLPGEFEESQAVVLSWGEYDSNENVDTTSNLARISAQLCMGIQPEAQVWIRVHKASDTLPVKRYMAQTMNQPLYNYRFIVKHGDNWWTRDFGPIGYYHGSQDSLGFNDFKYYPGREHDNVLPATISYKNNWKHSLNPLSFEGGNLIADGFGTVFYSSVVQTANAAVGSHFPTMSSATIADSMRRVLKADRIIQLPALSCDGGTGHLDLYLKMMDEETWIAAQYPAVVTAVDRNRSEENITLIKNRNSVYNRPFRVFRLPLPTDNNGTYNQQITCTGLNNSGRSFINGITVNKTFIYPIWDSPTSGNRAQRMQVEKNLKEWFPGLKLVGIDVRAMTGFGGQLHCITMQIPTDNPVKFWHPAYRDNQDLLPEYRLKATIKNRSGIANAGFKWRVGSNGVWQEGDLTDSADFFVGSIPGQMLEPGDTVHYFLRAQTNNGKEAFKPITAPEGYFWFVVNTPLNNSRLRDALSYQLFPNPGNGLLELSAFTESAPEIQVWDAMGRLAFSKKMQESSLNHQIDLRNLPAGVYRIQVINPGRLPQMISYTKF